MKTYKFRINGNLYEVEVLDIEGNTARIEVNGTVYDVEMQKELPGKPVSVPPVRTRIQKAEKPPVSEGAQKPAEIRAPLPGVIIQVLVRQGDEVISGQTLCTLETMKMENAIKAEKAGKISVLNISSGQSVLQDDVLMIINP
ncbi:MAG: biotin/lipoyl-binding protein [Bacteroidales bacterium]|nr:biotin/lipoyl-binding protein [Bacteroidales bacterium]MBN2632596.1 biotin/lipoyl-binding protein [Bacteroidales bacterium]